MASTPLPTAPEDLTGSWSSAKFRKMLLMESIASVFSKQGSSPTALPPDSEEGTRQDSASTNDTAHKTSRNSCWDREKDGYPPVPTSASGNPVLRPAHSSDGSGSTLRPGEVADIAADPMSNHTEGGINYRSLRWWQAGMLMIAETISLGILSLPKALSTLGLIPGLILLVGLGALASYTGFVIGQFKLLHPEVHSMGDAGYILFGRFGRELLGAGQLIFIIFIMGSHILTFSIMMNAITSHATCTIIFMLIGMVISILFTLPRTLRGLTWLCVASFISIIAAVGTTTIGVSITQPGRLHNGQHGGAGYLSPDLWPQANLSFHEAFLAVANIVFAYAGHVAFFSFISEFRRPRDFPKVLALLQCSDISLYIVSSVVIYYYAGRQVASPALDSASPVVRKIAYGLGIPTIVIAGVVNGHVAVKYVFVRLLRPGGWLAAWSGRRKGASTQRQPEAGHNGNAEDEKPSAFTEPSEPDLLHSKGAAAWSIWIAIVTVIWVVAWLISEGVPVFNDLLGLTSALFASWFTYGLSGMFWCHMNLERQGWRVGWKDQDQDQDQDQDDHDHEQDDNRRSKKKAAEGWKRWCLLLVNLLCVAVGAVICGAGLYSSGKSIAGHAGEGRSFSCADNS